MKVKQLVGLIEHAYGRKSHKYLMNLLNDGLDDINDIKSLSDDNVENKLEYVAEAIIQTKKKLNNEIPLIGFSGSPWTLSTYMIEGSATKEFRKIRSIVFKDPKMLNDLTKKLIKSISNYLIMQAKVGANVLMIFDSWGGLLNTENYLHFSLDNSYGMAGIYNQKVDKNKILR